MASRTLGRSPEDNRTEQAVPSVRLVDDVGLGFTSARSHWPPRSLWTKPCPLSVNLATCEDTSQPGPSLQLCGFKGETPEYILLELRHGSCCIHFPGSLLFVFNKSGARISSDLSLLFASVIGVLCVLLHLSSYLCMCGGAQMPWHPCGRWRTTDRSQLSPTMWVPGIEIRWRALAAPSCEP